MKRILLAAAAVAFAGAAYAAPATTQATMGSTKILADSKGMVLYTYDRDTAGTKQSACTGGCPGNWPAFMPGASDTASGDWTIVNAVDHDGGAIKQWAYKGKPVYYYVKDMKPGDATGDNVGMIWHVVKM